MEAHCIWGTPYVWRDDNDRFNPKIFCANDFLRGTPPDDAERQLTSRYNILPPPTRAHVIGCCRSRIDYSLLRIKKWLTHIIIR